MNNDTIVIRPGALGDAVLTLPVLQTLRAAGTERVAVLGTPAHWSWLNTADGSVEVDDWNGAEWLGLFSQDVDLSETARRQLRGIRRAVVYLRSGADAAAQALRRAGVSAVLTAAPPAWPEHPDDAHDDRHAAERLLQPLRQQAVPMPDLNLDHSREPLLSVTAGEQAEALAALGMAAAPAGGFFAVHPGSGGESKCWPLERFIELLTRAAERTDAQPLVFMGPVEEERLSDQIRQLPKSIKTARSLPLRQVMALLSMTRVFAGNDAGITHLAGRCCPTIQLFGPTRPSRWKALGPDVTAIEAPEGELGRLGVDVVWTCDRMDRALSADA
jgi:hypothetical protein